jgi:hypothetical protein
LTASGFIASVEALSRAGASTLADAENLTIRNEWSNGMLGLSENQPLDEFFNVLFQDSDDTRRWPDAKNIARAISSRSDIVNLLTALIGVDDDEKNMYPIWSMIADIIILHCSATADSPVPEPYFEKIGACWRKSAAANEWIPPYTKFCVVDKHSHRLEGLITGVRCVWISMYI